MKDEHDKCTLELVEAATTGGARALERGTADGVASNEEKPKPKRLPRQSAYRPPQGAKPADPSNWAGNLNSVVPVSSVARDWGISSRRVRTMLTEGRLSGRQLENGYWEVFYPYRYVFGTRGPEIKRQRNLPPPTRPKRQEVPEQMKDWF